MKEKIVETLRTLVAMKSVSCSEVEQEPAKWFYAFFKSLPYFQKHPELCGLREIPNDPYGRLAPYALLLGKKKDTVVFSGHYDVVSTEEYGKVEPLAYTATDELKKALKEANEKGEITFGELAKQDIETDEWLWGRGACDMKGGLGMQTVLFSEYAELADKGELEGSLLLLPVCDEESYSTGMRYATGILKELMEKYELKYKLLIDPEPTAELGEKQVISIGTVGKIMPAVLVQGVKGHMGHCYNGFSALSIISEIYRRTNGCLDFCDTYKDEAAVPPTWGNLRDMKHVYDVSIPHRASGYFTLLSFTTTPEEVMDKLKTISKEAFEMQVEKLDSEYQQYKKLNKFETKEKIYYEPCVMSFGELCEEIRKKDAAGFDLFFKEASARAIKRVNSGELSFPDATVAIMEETLDFSGIMYPITIIAFAPPYYPPTHSDLVKGKENTGQAAFETIRDESKKFGVDVTYENFFLGISDLSYGCVTAPFDYEKYSFNTPLWGDAYNMDFDGMEKIAIPSIIYGPIGRNYHEATERVNIRSLTEVVPAVTKKLVERMWAL